MRNYKKHRYVRNFVLKSLKRLIEIYASSKKPIDYLSRFQPTKHTKILDGDADWDLPDGLEEGKVFGSDPGKPTVIEKFQTLLSDGLEGVVVKRLSAVESDPAKSNQHEFNGSASLRRLLGENDRKHIVAQFIRLDDTGEAAAAIGELSWYDARRKHPTRTEFRLYYRENVVTASMREGDLFFLVLRKDKTALVAIDYSAS